jgi:uncharacterized protein (TIGR02246 family)
MSSADETKAETEIQGLLHELTAAWNRGDAEAYGTRFQADGTFTNVFGGFYVGRKEFDRRHQDILRGIFEGSTVTMEVRKLRFLRPDVAVLDVATGLIGVQVPPQGVAVGSDGALHSSLLMVLAKERGRWEIAAYHNVWRSAGH